MNPVEDSFFHYMDELSVLMPDMPDVYLEKRKDAGDDGRHYAYCMVDGGDILIAYAPDMPDLPDPQINGLVLHEIGHAIDFAYSQNHLEMLLDVRLSDDPEERADQIVEYVFGETIQYELPDYIQCVGVDCEGGARPEGLR